MQGNGEMWLQMREACGARARKRCTDAGEKSAGAVRPFAAAAVARGRGEETRGRCGRRARTARETAAPA